MGEKQNKEWKIKNTMRENICARWEEEKDRNWGLNAWILTEMERSRKRLEDRRSEKKRCRQMNIFCAKKKYKIRFVFSNNIAVLSLYIRWDETKLDCILYYAVCHYFYCFHMTISQFIHWMTNKTTCLVFSFASKQIILTFQNNIRSNLFCLVL